VKKIFQKSILPSSNLEQYSAGFVACSKHKTFHCLIKSNDYFFKSPAWACRFNIAFSNLLGGCQFSIY